MLVAEGITSIYIDMPVCTFDFRGSGQSTGEYVSYGYHERTDLQHVLDHLTN
jgi:alpha/beta superfamily hydrolase